MKFRVTIEQLKYPSDEFGYTDDHKPYWETIKTQEIEIHIAERAARQIEKLIRDEGLDINPNELRSILFEELHECKESTPST